MARFSGAVALVTGAASGIGAAVARRLLAEGAACVIFADLDGDAAHRASETAAGETDDAGRALAVSLDVADADRVDVVFEGILASHGRLDLVVHAAGVDDPAAKAEIGQALQERRPLSVTAGLDPARWRRVLSVNLDGTFYVVRAALRAMAARAGGSIVLIGSSAAFDCPAGYPHYSASKAGVHAFAQAVAKEAIAFGVRVNVVAPGPTLTAMAERTPAQLKAAMTGGDRLPYATADQIADSVLYLASEQARNVVGAILLSNGGRFTA